MLSDRYRDGPLSEHGRSPRRWVRATLGLRLVFVLLVGISVGIGTPRSMEADEAGTWEALPEISMEKPLASEVAVWTGTEMLAFGTSSILGGGQAIGVRYDPNRRSWSPMSTVGAPNQWTNMSAVWTGSEMLLLGDLYLETIARRLAVLRPIAARYSPATDSWRPISLEHAQIAVRDTPRVWTGQELLIWGGIAGDGRDPPERSYGAAYNPSTDTWRPLARQGAPSPRSLHAAVWTGAEMLVWGGEVRQSGYPGEQRQPDDGAAYDPVTDTWRPIAPSGPGLDSCVGRRCEAVWTGAHMLVWDGMAGAAYDPSTDRWSPIAGPKEPTPVSSYPSTLLWTGSEMLYWGRSADCCPPQAVGTRYVPLTDSWTPLPTEGAPPLRRSEGKSPHQVAVWTGDALIVWSGVTGQGGLWRPTTWQP